MLKKALAERNFEWDVSEEGCVPTPSEIPLARGAKGSAQFFQSSLSLQRAVDKSPLD